MGNLAERAIIPAGVPTPRIVGGVLKWYAGDTFRLQVDLELRDENGDALHLSEGQTVTFVFRDETGRKVYELCCADIEDNRVVLWFTEEVSALFPRGRYTYDVIYRGAVRRMLAHKAPVIVE